ncbi:hypothetical protein QO002_002977 [Pararhizobium capsulatum DSM 1112]|uniref:Uncharacterized protein n=1 Tax=Pararhizobium capsulatum DSM 1112 TaxID=1121113 RepID=A0ABU0BRH3_9HYPH|nr:hypothetical protein [Pararhizobium capsulatum]MDQ0320839.1 hypothetical protein [Pararhizobium capsulatum DSM 1112]
MPRGGKDKTTETDDVGPLEEAPDGHETFGQALSRVGFEPAKVGRRIVSQGRRRETLKNRASEDADK